jgi:hypothetical protein
MSAYEQCMVDEVEVDLKCRVAVMQTPAPEAAYVDVSRALFTPLM